MFGIDPRKAGFGANADPGNVCGVRNAQWLNRSNKHAALSKKICEASVVSHTTIITGGNGSGEDITR